MARHKRPDSAVIFTALPETEPYASGLGEFLPTPEDDAYVASLMRERLSWVDISWLPFTVLGEHGTVDVRCPQCLQRPATSGPSKGTSKSTAG